MSATYRQTSACDADLRTVDPQNVLLARGPAFRLPAEMMRDSALFTSGLLVDRMGGPPVKPYQPLGLWKETGWISFERDEGEGSHRRSLYTYWKRTSPPPSMMTLDTPDREVCVAQRQFTSTPLQPLVLLKRPTIRRSGTSACRVVSSRCRRGRIGGRPHGVPKMPGPPPNRARTRRIDRAV